MSGREIEILKLIAGALTNNEVAEDLGISVETVKRHVTNICDKIGAHNRVAMAMYAVRKGFVVP